MWTAENLVHFKLSGYGVMRTRQVNSIQELFHVQALRQTASTEPSVGILVSSAKSDDDDDNNTVLQASPGAELTVNVESELTGKRRLQQVSTLYDRHRNVQSMIADVEQTGEAKIASRVIRNFQINYEANKAGRNEGILLVEG